MVPTRTTGHSTSPVTSASRPSSWRRARPSAAAAGFGLAQDGVAALGRIEHHLGGGELGGIVGEIL